MQNPWQPLFASGYTSGGETVTVRFRVLHRNGKPFLFLPDSKTTATRALDLYPAQSTKARIARRLLKSALRAGFAPGAKRLVTQIPKTGKFALFLSKAAGLTENNLPKFAVLAGNPKAPGRRFVFLLFDDAGNPVAVVKAGHEPDARLLIVHETAVLSTSLADAKGIPQVRHTFSSSQVEAFATDFISGQSPVGDVTSVLGKLFSSWLNPSEKIQLGELDAWITLGSSGSHDPLPPAVVALGKIEVTPTLMHGDFAPWNVKVEGARWTVLDWERGEISGVPGWDWMNFVIQPAIRVSREEAGATLARLETLFASPEFSSYAQRSSIAGHAHALTLAYLLYCIRVTRQTEGLQQISALLKLVEGKMAAGQTIQNPPGNHNLS